MFVIAAGRGFGPLETFYVLFYLLLLAKAFLFRMANPSEVVFDVEHYALRSAPLQVLMGVGLGIAVSSPALLLGRFTPLADPFSEFITQAVFVAFVETVFLIVMVRTVWLSFPRPRGRRWVWVEANVGVVLQPILFALLHPAVREAWLSGDFSLASVAAFLYAAVFGVLFWIVFEGRTRFKRYGPLFGATTVWTMHTTVNLVLLAFSLSIGGFTLFPV